VRFLRALGVGALALAASCVRPAEPTFVGSAACAPCHAAEQSAWLGSDHQRAMQPADSATVLGDFASREMVHFGDSTRLTRHDGKWWQSATDLAGRRADFPVAFTFGVRPLQQYLTAFPRGRFQVLPAIRDVRPAAAGGQRWYHLYPDEPIPPGDELHWAGRAGNWNTMCAECHVTDYRKGYIAASDSFDTRFAELGVGCEACHGPGSAHVSEARRVADGGHWRDSLTYDFPVAFRQRRLVAWSWDSAAHRPVRSAAPPPFRAEVETCARCHARRGLIAADYRYGRTLLDTHRPALLDAPLYYPDGQIRDEVYEYGSFLQSRMYQRGVTCSDCHDPHSQRLLVPGNAVCELCHRATRYDAPSHTFHRAGTPGSACVDCHMAPRTYMVVDVRRDHSMRIPRPDVSVRDSTPDACTTCHRNRDARWAAAAVARWYGPGRVQGAHFADAFVAAEAGRPDAETALVRVARSEAAPMVRATALHYLAGYGSPAALATLQDGLASPEPLLRLGALSALDRLEPLQRLFLAASLLRDTVLAVRIEAATALADVPADRLTEDQRRALAAALEDYRRSENLNADLPQAHLNLGLIAARQGDAAGADSAYRAALRLDSLFVPAYVNLADLYRQQGKDREGEPLLRRAAALAPDNPDVHYALALLLVRLKRYGEATPELERAAALAPGDPRIREALAALRGGR
jgi:HEAT repeat protein